MYKNFFRSFLVSVTTFFFLPGTIFAEEFNSFDQKIVGHWTADLAMGLVQCDWFFSLDGKFVRKITSPMAVGSVMFGNFKVSNDGEILTMNHIKVETLGLRQSAPAQTAKLYWEDDNLLDITSTDVNKGEPMVTRRVFTIPAQRQNDEGAKTPEAHRQSEGTTAVEQGSVIQLVQNGILKICPTHTVDQMVKGFMGYPSWESGVSSDGKVFVNVGGDINFHNKPVRAMMQFLVQGANFSFNSFEMNGVPSANLIAIAMMQKMCESVKAEDERETELEIQGDAEESQRYQAASQLKNDAPAEPNVTENSVDFVDSEGESEPEIQQPSVQIGDSYTYQSTDQLNPAFPVMTKKTVIASNDGIVLSNIVLNKTKAKPRKLYFDSEWCLIKTRNYDSGGKNYTPSLKYYSFPLFTGKIWQQVSTETDIKTGKIRIHTINGTVNEWEDVTVPAGMFHAIKVSLDTVVFDPNTGETVNGTDTSWYVPEVHRSVKSVTTGKDGESQMIQLISYELKLNK